AGQGGDVPGRRVHHRVHAEGDGRRHRLLLGADDRSVGADRGGGADRRLHGLGQGTERGAGEEPDVVPGLAGRAAEVHRTVRLVQPADVAGRGHVGVLAAGAEGDQAAERDRGDHPVLQPGLLRRAAAHRRRGAEQVPRRPVRHPGDAEGLAGRGRAGLRPVTAVGTVAGPETVPARRTRKGRGALRVPPIVWLFLIIPVAVEVFWVFWPAFNSFQLSLTRWQGVGAAEFIGLQNYLNLSTDPVFLTALRNNAIWVVLFGGLSVIGGLTLAVLLNRPRRGVGIYRAAIYLPMVF